jgi:hypothetical protein
MGQAVQERSWLRGLAVQGQSAAASGFSSSRPAQQLSEQNPEHPEKPERAENPENPERPERPENPERQENPEDPQNPGTPATPYPVGHARVDLELHLGPRLLQRQPKIQDTPHVSCSSSLAI